jgi:uncharacterized protein YggE
MRNSWIATVVGGAAIGALAVGVVAMINNTSSTPSDTAASAVTAPTTTTTVDTGESPIVKRTVTVSGHGKVTVKPDTATLSMGVSVTGSKANEALRLAADKSDAMIKVLTTLGVKTDDIQTSGLSLYPQYDVTGRKVTGYNVTNNLSITIRKLGDAGSIIDAAAAYVGNEITIGGISFYVDDTEAALANARKDAMSNAKLRADQYTAGAQVAVGQVLTISEVSSPISGPVYYASADKAAGSGAATSIQPGTQDLTVDVTVVYELK